MTSPLKTYIITEPKIENTGRHESFMNIARKFAKTSEFPTSRMASVLTRSGRVISVGVNKEQSGFLKHKAYTKNQAHHAELDCVLRANPDQVRGATLYVAGYTRAGSECWSSRPCDSCREMLRELGVKAVIFHDDKGGIYKWSA